MIKDTTTPTRFIGVLALLSTAIAAQAASIVWITDGTTGSRVAIDSAFTTLLANAGHTVTAYNGADNPAGADLAFLEAADLIVHGGKEEGSTNASIWNAIATPIIMMAPYTADAWGMTSDTNPNYVGNVTVTVPSGAESDPIWNGIGITGGVTDNSIFNGVRGYDGGFINGATTLASNGSVDLIARWGAGTLATGERMYFASNNSDVYGLTATGDQVFLNAIDSMVVPEPSTFALFGLAGGMLIVRRRRH